MNDKPKDQDSESPMQRALRLKKAAQPAHAQPGGAIKPRGAAGMPHGASKPKTRK